MEACEAMPVYSSCRWSPGQWMLAGLGTCLLVVWLLWWADALANNRLRGQRSSWLPIATLRSIDFYPNYYGGRAWIKGGNPYVDQKVPNDHPYGLTYGGYPPPCIWQFGWCAWMKLARAKNVWLLVSVAILAAATAACLRVRRDLNLWRPPWPFALACVLFCSPVVFELERGQCNVLVLLHLLLAVFALRRQGWLADACVGVLTALAFWTKIYPLVLIAALLPLRRWRALACAVVAVVLMALADLPGLEAAQRNMEALSPPHRPLITGIFYQFQHSLGAWWTFLWRDTPWERLGQVPELLSATCLLLPLIGMVSLAVFRLPAAARQRVTLPFFLWLTGVATFTSPMAYDYCLFFLPFAILAAWDWRDSLAATALMIASLVWLQPLANPVPPLLFMGLKLATVGGLTLSLRARCRELSPAYVSRSNRTYTSHGTHSGFDTIPESDKSAQTSPIPA
jgi:hypothetical protein